jgi:hypothetical protein
MAQACSHMTTMCALPCRLLDDNRELYVPELREAVRPHPHFMLFATQNPAGGAYAGRRPLSRAFRSRFLVRRRRCHSWPTTCRRLAKCEMGNADSQSLVCCQTAVTISRKT